MYYTRLTRNRRVRLVHFFIEDVDASTAARLLSINRKTANAWYSEIRHRLVPLVPRLPPLTEIRGLKGYHERRIAKFNGLRRSVLPYHVLESRVRFQLKSRFKAVVLELASDLLR